MKKTFYILLALALIITSFFYYENTSFNKYIENPTKNSTMNIPININAPVIARNQMEIEAPIDTVWKVLTDIKGWPTWQNSVSETEVLGKIEEGTLFQWKAGSLAFKSKIHTSKPKTEFGWTGTTIGASAIHNWTFTKNGNNTMVVVEESLQGIFPKLFKSYFQKNLDNGVLTNLKELKLYSEMKNK